MPWSSILGGLMFRDKTRRTLKIPRIPGHIFPSPKTSLGQRGHIFTPRCHLLTLAEATSWGIAWGWTGLRSRYLLNEAIWGIQGFQLDRGRASVTWHSPNGPCPGESHCFYCWLRTTRTTFSTRLMWLQYKSDVACLVAPRLVSPRSLIRSRCIHIIFRNGSRNH